MQVTTQQGGEGRVKQVLDILLAEQNILCCAFWNKYVKKWRKEFGILNLGEGCLSWWLVFARECILKMEGRSLFLSGLVLLFLLKYCYELCDSGIFAASAEWGILSFANDSTPFLKQGFRVPSRPTNHGWLHLGKVRNVFSSFLVVLHF